MLLRIMLGAFLVVNATAEELPVHIHPAKADLKDSVKAPTKKNEFSQLAEFLMKTGKDGKIPENMAPDLGLPGARPGKGVFIKGTSCILVYEESPDSTIDDRRPLCFLLINHRVFGLDTETKNYRVNLDGQLEKFLAQRGKVDEQGRPVQGSAIQTYPDINSHEVKKAFAAEMREVRAWLKQQMKLATKTATVGVTNPEGATKTSAPSSAASAQQATQ